MAINTSQIRDLLRPGLREVSGKYENIPITDLNLRDLLTDCRKAFNKSIKQMEIELTNLKKGE